MRVIYEEGDEQSERVYREFAPTCEFVLRVSPSIGHRVVCGKPAVGVYVSADHFRELVPFCAEHLARARDGDGPTYRLVRVEKEAGHA